MVDDYLNDTGRNTFKADEFITWLETQPDHPHTRIVSWKRRRVVVAC